MESRVVDGVISKVWIRRSVSIIVRLTFILSVATDTYIRLRSLIAPKVIQQIVRELIRVRIVACHISIATSSTISVNIPA